MLFTIPKGTVWSVCSNWRKISFTFTIEVSSNVLPKIQMLFMDVKKLERMVNVLSATPICHSNKYKKLSSVIRSKKTHTVKMRSATSANTVSTKRK